MVIADDLTGANEVAVHFAKHHIATAVVLDWQEDLETLPDKFQVIAVNTESRHESTEEAQRRMEKVVDTALKREIPYYYKKTDSTLRGNVAVELEVLRKKVGEGKVMFIPANPAMGRTVHDGVLYVKGKPLAFSEFSDDPLEPARESHIIKYLHSQIHTPYHLITNEMKQNTAFGKELSLFNEKGCYVFDTLSEQDFSQIGNLLKRSNLLHLLAGSGGFASVLPELIEFEKQPSHPNPQTSRRLIINGSLNPVAHQQMQWAQSQQIPIHILDITKLFANEGVFSAYQKDLADWLLGVYQAENLALVTTPRQPLTNHSSMVEDQDIVGRDGRLGRVIMFLLSQVHVDLLGIFGGDTSLAILKALHQQYIEAISEIIPGVALLKPMNSESNHWYLVTKPGGFGEENVVGLIEQYFRSL